MSNFVKTNEGYFIRVEDLIDIFKISEDMHLNLIGELLEEWLEKEKSK